MMKKRREKGSHTWDIHIRYHQCPNCSSIIESRQDYTYVMGRYQKELTCSNCAFEFVTIKEHTPTFGPLFD